MKVLERRWGFGRVFRDEEEFDGGRRWEGCYRLV